MYNFFIELNFPAWSFGAFRRLEVERISQLCIKRNHGRWVSHSIHLAQAEGDTKVRRHESFESSIPCVFCMISNRNLYFHILILCCWNMFYFISFRCSKEMPFFCRSWKQTTIQGCDAWGFKKYQAEISKQAHEESQWRDWVFKCRGYKKTNHGTWRLSPETVTGSSGRNRRKQWRRIWLIIMKCKLFKLMWYSVTLQVIV